MSDKVKKEKEVLVEISFISIKLTKYKTITSCECSKFKYLIVYIM